MIDTLNMGSASLAAQSKAQSGTSLVDSDLRQSDRHMQADHEQVGNMSSLMRRMEDLSDRLGGVMPSTASNDPASAQRAGFIGQLIDLHETRYAIIGRMQDALTRIETMV